MTRSSSSSTALRGQRQRRVAARLASLVLGGLLGVPWAWAATSEGLLAAAGKVTAVETLHGSSFTLSPLEPSREDSPLVFAVDADTVIIKNGDSWPWSEMLLGAEPVQVRYVMEGSRRLVRWMCIGPWQAKRLTGTIVDADLMQHHLTLQPEPGAGSNAAPLQLTTVARTLALKAGQPQPLEGLQPGELVTAEYTEEAGQKTAHLIEIHPIRDVPTAPHRAAP